MIFHNMKFCEFLIKLISGFLYNYLESPFVHKSINKQFIHKQIQGKCHTQTDLAIGASREHCVLTQPRPVQFGTLQLYEEAVLYATSSNAGCTERLLGKILLYI